jgi:hypothetical protein
MNILKPRWRVDKVFFDHSEVQNFWFRSNAMKQTIEKEKFVVAYLSDSWGSSTNRRIIMESKDMTLFFIREAIRATGGCKKKSSR